MCPGCCLSGFETMGSGVVCLAKITSVVQLNDALKHTLGAEEISPMIRQELCIFVFIWHSLVFLCRLFVGPIFSALLSHDIVLVCHLRCIVNISLCSYFGPFLLYTMYNSWQECVLCNWVGNARERHFPLTVLISVGSWHPITFLELKTFSCIFRVF